MNTLDNLFAYEKSTAYAMQAWFESRCTHTIGHSETCKALWNSWQSWAQSHDHYLASRKRLGAFLRSLGLRPIVLRSGTERGWSGIAIKAGDA